LKLLLIGFGTVGQGFAEILRDKAALLREQSGFVPVIIGVATRSGGTLYHPDGLDVNKLLAAAAQGGINHYPDTPGLRRDMDTLTLIQNSGADALLEASITNLQTGQPATDYCLAALAAGQHVILANKGPIALAYAELKAAAQKAGKQLRFEGTVMAGTPSLTLALEALAGCTILEARGILNGTTNYMLTQMAQGVVYADALAEAQRLGYAEADPTADVDGWDAAGKLLILAAALYGKKLSLTDMPVKGISGITPADIEAARQAGEVYKLIASVTPAGGSVNPERVPLNHPLAVSGGTNAITFKTDLMGEITLVGAGAGRLQTGFALLADVLAIHRQNAGAPKT
jgi:homoserine dehydrogenase